MDAFRRVSATFWYAYDSLVKLTAVVGGILLLYMVLSIGFEVGSRYLFDRPTRWVVEGAEYTMLYLTFLSAVWLLPQRGHTRMTFVIENLGPRRARQMEMMGSALAAVICAILGWQTGTDTLELFIEGRILPANLPIPKFLVWWIMPFGFLMMMIQFLRFAYQDLLVLQGEDMLEERSSEAAASL